MLANVHEMFYSENMDMQRDNIQPELRTPGRASESNRVGRFEPLSRTVVDDGWERETDPAVVRTEITVEQPRKVLTRNTSPDLHFDRSVNTYRGCEHGCIYCFARPTHAFLGLSPGLDFETKLVARPGAPDVLRRELSGRNYQCAPIAIGTNTDPYQPCDNDLRITRQVLEVMLEFNHPITIVTKGTLIERDVDLLAELARRNLVQVGISLTTLDRHMARAMEPRVPTPARRLATIKCLADAGCSVRLMLAPVVPGLTDHELENIVTAAADAGASGAEWIMLRLPLEVSELFKEWLRENYPDRAAKVMARVRQTHGGKDYDAQWGKRMRGQGIHAELIEKRFSVAVKRTGLHRNMPRLRCDLFKVPGRAEQLTLF